MTFVVSRLKSFGFDVDIYDPVAGINEVTTGKSYDAIVVGTAHSTLEDDLKKLERDNSNKRYTLVP